MSDMTQWMALLGAEVLLVLFVLLFISWLRAGAARRRDAKAVKQLIASVRKAKPDREKTIEQFLANNMGLQGQALQEYKVKLMREEMRLLQGFADVYRRRDATAAASFQITAEPALDAYHGLSGDGSALVEGAGVEADEGELEALRKENARLSEELSVTMDTMSRMLSEYSTMFSSSEEAASVPTADPATAMDEVAEASVRDVPALDEAELDIGDAVEPETVSAEAAGDAQESLMEGGGEILDTLADETAEVAGLDEPAGALDQEQDAASGSVEEELGLEMDSELDTGVDDLDALFDEDEETEEEKAGAENSIAI